MANTITLNGTEITTCLYDGEYNRNVRRIGGLERAIDGTLVDLTVATKRTWRLMILLSTHRAFLEGLLGLSSFTFVDHEDSSFTARMTDLTINRWPITYRGTATITLEEV